jgi:hypothetical protein
MAKTTSLRTQFARVKSVATDPAFIKVLEKIKEAPLSKRRAILRAWARPSALKRVGIPVGAGMRITTRYFFEDQKVEGKIRSRVPGKRTNKMAVSKGICACFGGKTVCFGTGGS